MPAPAPAGKTCNDVTNTASRIGITYKQTNGFIRYNLAILVRKALEDFHKSDLVFALTEKLD